MVIAVLLKSSASPGASLRLRSIAVVLEEPAKFFASPTVVITPIHVLRQELARDNSPVNLRTAKASRLVPSSHTSSYLAFRHLIRKLNKEERRTSRKLKSWGLRWWWMRMGSALATIGLKPECPRMLQRLYQAQLFFLELSRDSNQHSTYQIKSQFSSFANSYQV